MCRIEGLLNQFIEKTIHCLFENENKKRFNFFNSYVFGYLYSNH